MEQALYLHLIGFIIYNGLIGPDDVKWNITLI